MSNDQIARSPGDVLNVNLTHAMDTDSSQTAKMASRILYRSIKLTPNGTFCLWLRHLICSWRLDHVNCFQGKMTWHESEWVSFTRRIETILVDVFWSERQGPRAVHRPRPSPPHHRFIGLLSPPPPARFSVFFKSFSSRQIAKLFSKNVYTYTRTKGAGVWSVTQKIINRGPKCNEYINQTRRWMDGLCCWFEFTDLEGKWLCLRKREREKRAHTENDFWSWIADEWTVEANVLLYYSFCFVHIIHV